ncbi:MAG: PHP domain-containing protein [Acidimicrobiia bacterium]|nr:PHP domain-containing protein [Acidimicrobiia bacterium]
MAVDLHLHSRFSDGSDSPTEIVNAAADLGLTGIALTDHDTLDGIPEAAAAAAARGIHFVGGTELSVSWRDLSMHMLVYFLEPGPGPLQDRLGTLRESRHNRNLEITARLADLGIDIAFADVQQEAGRGVVGRPHFAGVLMAKGHVASIAEAFDRYLADGRPAYVPRMRLTAAEAIDLARATSAVAVIAHPHTLQLRSAEFAAGFRELVDVGLGGIEAHYSEYTAEMRARIAEICAELGIVATGGSDYHGTYKPGLAIGVGRGDLRVPDEALQRLAEIR